MPKIIRPSRRSLLQGLALGALGAGLPWGKTQRAVAQSATIPKRIIFFYGSGMLYDDWAPVAPGGSGKPSETSWDFGLLHQPLAPYKDHCLYVDGLGMRSEGEDTGPAGNAHNQGAKHSLAAANTTATDMPGDLSIDQYIANGINSPAPVTAHHSLQLQAANWSNGAYSGAIASGPNQPLPSIRDPRQAYDKLFADFTPPDTEDTSLADALAAQQAAAFGLAKDDFARLLVRLPASERQRVQVHLDLLSDLEARLKLPPAGGQGCVMPDPIGELGSCDFQCYGMGPEQDSTNFNLSADHHSRLSVAALACDLTRVVFLEVAYGADLDYGYTNGDFGTTDMHDLVHKVNDANNPLATTAAARKVVQDQCIVEAQKLANLLGMLQAVPEADGSTLLDHTIVLWCGQIAYGSHDVARLPWMIIGSGGGHFRTGRYVSYGDPESLGMYTDRGLPHNNLFVSLANAMGIETDTFGNPSVCTGPLDNLRA